VIADNVVVEFAPLNTIPALIRSLASDNAERQLYSCKCLKQITAIGGTIYIGAISLMSEEEKLMKEMLTSGGVAVLVSRVNSSDKKIAHCAVKTLCNIAADGILIYNTII